MWSGARGGQDEEEGQVSLPLEMLTSSKGPSSASQLRPFVLKWFHLRGVAECLGAGEVAFELRFQQEEWEGGNSKQNEDMGSWT